MTNFKFHLLLLISDHSNLIESKSIKVPKYYAVNGFILPKKVEESGCIFIIFLQLFLFPMYREYYKTSALNALTK